MPSADDFLDAADTKAAPVKSADAFLDVEEKPGVAEDTLKSLASGVGTGIASTPYWLADLGNLANLGVQKGYEYYRDVASLRNPEQNQPLTRAQEQKIEGYRPFLGSQEILKPAEDLTGIHPYQPQTTAGSVADIIGNIVGFGGLSSPRMVGALGEKAGNLASTVGQTPERIDALMQNSATALPKTAPPSRFAPKNLPAELQAVPDRAWAKSHQILKTALQDEGIKAEDIANALEEAQKMHPNLPVTAIDVAAKDIGGVQVQGRNLLGLADASANMPGQGAAMAGNVSARGYVAKQRIGDTFDKAISKNNLYEVSDDALNKMATDAPAAYQKAFEGGSIAPLETQFQKTFQENAGKVSEAAKKVQEAERDLLRIEAKSSMNANVYVDNALRGERKTAQAFLSKAQAELGAAQGEEKSIMETLRQAQADRANGAKGAIWNPRIQEFMKDDIVQSGIKKGIWIARKEALAEGKPFNPTEYAITGFDKAGDPIVSAVPNMRLLDAGKKGLDAIINESKNPLTGKLNETGRAVSMLKKSYVDEIDKLNPDYAFARQTYADEASRLKAINNGRDFMKMDKEEITKFMKSPDTSAAEKSAFSVGVRRSLQDMMSNVGDNANAITRLWKEGIRDRLEPLFHDKKSFEEFTKNMQHEQNMVRVNTTMTRGSQTMPRQQYAGMIEQEPSKIGKIIKAVTDPLGAAGETGASMMSDVLKKSAKGMSNDTAAGIMHYLTSKDPQLWRELAGIPQPASKLAKAAKIGGIGTAATAGALGTAEVMRHQNLKKPTPLKVRITPEDKTGELPKVDLPGSEPQSSIEVPESFKLAEGQRDKVYRDKAGNRTVGIGFNMDNPSAPDIWKQAGMEKDFNAVRAGKEKLDKESSQRLLETSYSIAQEDAKSLVPNFDKLQPYQQEAITHLAFQYGKPRLKEALPGVLAMANQGNGKAAAARLMASDYGKRFPNRAKALARMLFANEPYSQET